MGRHSVNRRKIILDRIVKGETIREYQINFKKTFERPVSKNGVQKITKKWNKKFAIKDLHRGRSGRPEPILPVKMWRRLAMCCMMMEEESQFVMFQLQLDSSIVEFAVFWLKK